METKENIEKFEGRWDIHPKYNFQDEFQKFKNRIVNIYKYVDQKIDDNGAFHFCNTLGVEKDVPNALNIINALEEEGNHKKFYFILEMLLNAPAFFFKRDACSQYRCEVFYVIEHSNINLAVAEHAGHTVLYPAGEPLLDRELVNKPLRFLSGDSLQHFSDALSHYKEKSYCTSAEAIRRSLEEFLREKLKNTKGLDKNIEELGKVLKGVESAREIRDIMHKTFDSLDKYFNEHSKHNSSVSAEDNEFLIYQTGLLMRYCAKNIN